MQRQGKENKKMEIKENAQKNITNKKNIKKN